MKKNAIPTGQLVLFPEFRPKTKADAIPVTMATKSAKTYKKQQSLVLSASIECAADAIAVADSFAKADTGQRLYHINYALDRIRTATRNTDLPLSKLLAMILEEIADDKAVA